VRPLLDWAPPVLGKWERAWEAAESRGLGDDTYQENLEWFHLF